MGSTGATHPQRVAQQRGSRLSASTHCGSGPRLGTRQRQPPCLRACRPPRGPGWRGERERFFQLPGLHRDGGQVCPPLLPSPQPLPPSPPLPGGLRREPGLPVQGHFKRPSWHWALGGGGKGLPVGANRVWRSRDGLRFGARSSQTGTDVRFRGGRLCGDAGTRLGWGQPAPSGLGTSPARPRASPPSAYSVSPGSFLKLRNLLPRFMPN